MKLRIWRCSKKSLEMLAGQRADGKRSRQEAKSISYGSLLRLPGGPQVAMKKFLKSPRSPQRAARSLRNNEGGECCFGPARACRELLNLRQDRHQPPDCGSRDGSIGAERQYRYKPQPLVRLSAFSFAISFGSSSDRVFSNAVFAVLARPRRCERDKPWPSGPCPPRGSLRGKPVIDAFRWNASLQMLRYSRNHGTLATRGIVQQEPFMHVCTLLDTKEART